MKAEHSTAYPTALVTGGARRVGAAICRHLHQCGYTVLIHANRSVEQATVLAAELNQQRPGSARVLQADLADKTAPRALFAEATQNGSVELLVNNASSFFPTPLGTLNHDEWLNLRMSNLDAPLFLSQAFAQQTELDDGCIINMIDAMLPHGLARFSAYAAAKAGLAQLTLALAKELAPRIRVNGVAPGAILWEEPEPSEAHKQQVLAQIPLGRMGSPQDLAQAVAFLASAPYITGQILAVDGGRGL